MWGSNYLYSCLFAKKICIFLQLNFLFSFLSRAAFRESNLGPPAHTSRRVLCPPVALCFPPFLWFFTAHLARCQTQTLQFFPFVWRQGVALFCFSVVSLPLHPTASTRVWCDVQCRWCLSPCSCSWQLNESLPTKWLGKTSFFSDSPFRTPFFVFFYEILSLFAVLYVVLYVAFCMSLFCMSLSLLFMNFLALIFI